ncbi:MAG TPA: molybdate ABC transporter substrate-binding protein [Patescibacteria group bacterium]|nr:molybdate ABC transporter substrate-binding protein [Patescibacteria group bacterium]
MKPRIVLAVLAMIALAAFASGGASPSPSDATAPPSSTAVTAPSTAPPAEPVELIIFAGASLANALEQARAAYEAAHPGTTLTVSPDSSAALRTQIEQGAPADVFLSADTTNPQMLVDGGFAAGEAVVFAGNKLTIITPTDNPGGLTGPFDLAKDGILVVAAGDEVPITKYATQLVANLAAEAGAPPDFAAAYAANVASREDNVAVVRTKIELGEGDAAIVYVTDAAASDQVATIDVPDSANVLASYAGVVVKASPNLEAAHAFLDWLAGPDGQAVLAEFGFLPPPS